MMIFFVAVVLGQKYGLALIPAHKALYSPSHTSNVKLDIREEIATNIALAPRTPHLGDIMGKHLQTDMSIMSNISFTPMQRVVLTANGNFQRIVSSFFNQAVSVTVIKNLRIRAGLYEREVVISIGAKPCCVASSIVICLSPESKRLVDSASVGIGQLFGRLEELPKFSLIEVAKNDISFRRVYTLSSAQVVCHIEEVSCCTHSPALAGYFCAGCARAMSSSFWGVCGLCRLLFVAVCAPCCLLIFLCARALSISYFVRTLSSYWRTFLISRAP